jgi:hypothetical protein
MHLLDWNLLAELHYDLNAYAEEAAQWSHTTDLDADEEAEIDLSGFGEDENLIPPPHSLQGGNQ